jgi:hypothetical protein
MLFPRWFSRSHRPTRTFRPAVVALEDRSVPSRTLAFPVATHLQVIVPDTVQSGQTFDVFVVAETASNQVAFTYSGTVALSLGTADPTAVVPAPWTFGPGDRGFHDFKVSLSSLGSQTITAKDTSATNPIASGSATTNVTGAPQASMLKIDTSSQAAAGAANQVTVSVLDQSGNLMPGFTGKVTLSSNDATATGTASKATPATGLPLTYNFSPADHGQHVFYVTYNDTNVPGTGTGVTLSATSTASPAIGGASVTVYAANKVTHFAVVKAPVTYAGVAIPVQVQALNASGQVVSGYTGTVTLSSSDTRAKASVTLGGATTSLSSKLTYQFTAGDAGQHTFWVTFGSTGQQTLTAADSALALSDTESINVIVPRKPRPGTR